MARRDLVAFTEYTFPRYRAAELHRVIAGNLERVERGEVDRLMFLLPPRHGKSELASRRFPAWYLGRHPSRQLISASATTDLASDFGRDVRNTIASREYGNLFDTRLAEDSRAKGRWSTNKDGSYYAVGIGSAIMGRGAHVLIIDDPFAIMADAKSEVERKRVYDWYVGSAYNRLEEDAAVVIINHRMHESDLTGMLLDQQAAGGDRWEVVELKALVTGDDGIERALWPEKYDAGALARIRANTPAADWSSLYQQNPTPDEGVFFHADWLRPYVDMPDRRTLEVYGASDCATKDGEGDYTVHIVVGVDPEDRLYVLDLWRGQATSDVWVDAWADMVLKWRPNGWAGEKGQIENSVGPWLQKVAKERRAYTAGVLFPATGSKRVRAQSIQGRMAVRGLYVPTGAAWYPAFRGELLSFDLGRHDDQVDALSLIGQIIDKMVPGRTLAEDVVPKVVSTDPSLCNVTLNDLWDARPRARLRNGGRID